MAVLANRHVASILIINNSPLTADRVGLAQPPQSTTMISFAAAAAADPLKAGIKRVTIDGDSLA